MMIITIPYKKKFEKIIFDPTKNGDVPPKKHEKYLRLSEIC